MTRILDRNTVPDRAAFDRMFLALPKALYPREKRTQDTKGERAILHGTHPLSSEFTVRT